MGGGGRFGVEIGMGALPGLFDGVHRGVSGAKQAIGGWGVFGVNCEADTGGAGQHMFADRERLVETALEAKRNLQHVGAIMRGRNNGRELIAAETRENVAWPQLTLHAPSCLLQE